MNTADPRATHPLASRRPQRSLRSLPTGFDAAAYRVGQSGRADGGTRSVCAAGLAVTLALALALALAACAAPPGQPGGPGFARSARGQALEPAQAQARLTPGASSKQEVAAALGPAATVRFDSGHEIWVYRWPGRDDSPHSATELVLLFPPQGPLARMRLRAGGA